MSDVIFSLPGKLGDAFLQFPVAAQWARQTGKKFGVWLDEKSLKPIEHLLKRQPCVDGVEFKPGIEHYMCGGQPWHFGLETKDYEGKTVYHLGLRSFPVRQITLETAENVRLPIKLDTEEMASISCFEVEESTPANRLVLHAQTICPHTRSTPNFWKFIGSVKEELEHEFGEIVFVGSDRDREVGSRTYPDWSQYDDAGDFYQLAKFIAGSRCVIGVGSSIVALSSVMKVPTVRVHDPIGGAPKAIWSGLGDKQINDTDVELRKTWPEFRTRVLRERSLAEVVGG